MNDWPVSRSYSQPCQGHAIRSGFSESRAPSGRVGHRVAEQVPEAQRPALVRAAVADAVEASPTRNTPIERPPDLDDPPLAGGEAAQGRDDNPHPYPLYPALCPPSSPDGISALASKAAISRDPPDASTA